MLKPNLLREVLVKFAPYFKQNPDLLEVYVTSGHIQSTGTESVSYLNEYEINVFVMDFAGELDHLILAVLTWAKNTNRIYCSTLISVKQGYVLMPIF